MNTTKIIDPCTINRLIMDLLSIITVLFLFAYISNVHAEKKQVTATGKAVIDENTTLGQAKTNALNQARILAVEQAAGITVNNLTIIRENLILTDLVKTFSHGFLVKETSLVWQGTWVNSTNNDPGFPVLNVKLTGVVEVLPKSYFRNYALSATVDKNTYRDGESAQLSIKVTQDMYILVVNYTSRNVITPIFPNIYMQNNLLRKGQKFIIPENNNSRFDLVVHNYTAHKTDTEAFMVFGFPVDNHTRQIDWIELFENNDQINYSDFFQTVLELPLSWIAEKTLIYSIVRK